MQTPDRPSAKVTVWLAVSVEDHSRPRHECNTSTVTGKIKDPSYNVVTTGTDFVENFMKI